MPALAQLEQAAAQAWKDPAFTAELNQLLKNYVGRATPLYEAERLTAHYRRAGQLGLWTGTRGVTRRIRQPSDRPSQCGRGLDTSQRPLRMRSVQPRPCQVLGVQQPWAARPRKLLNRIGRAQ